MAQTVIGIFDTTAEAQQALEQLRFNGFSDQHIDVSTANSGSDSSSMTGTSTGTSTTDSTYGNSTYNNTNDHDGIGGFFRSLFSDDEDNARVYSDVARDSDCILTVHAQSSEEAQRAAEIMDRFGSVDVEERASQYGRSGKSAFAGTAPTSTTDTDFTGTASTNVTGTDYAGTSATNVSGADVTGSGTIPVIEENIEVGKREVQTGGARLRSRIVERPVEEHLRLRSEHVRVDRRTVDRPATEADFNSFREGDLEVTEHAEVPVVNKQARVVEEVSLGKEVEERDEVIRDTVRSTEVDVDRLNDTTDRTDLDLDRDRNTAL